MASSSLPTLYLINLMNPVLGIFIHILKFHYCKCAIASSCVQHLSKHDIGHWPTRPSGLPSVYTVPLQLSKVFSTRHFKGIDHIHLYATHKRVHMFNYSANMTAPATGQPGPLASQVPKCVPLQLSRSGDAQVAPQCNDQSCKNWRRNWGSQIPKYEQIFWKLSKSNVSCLPYA